MPLFVTLALNALEVGALLVFPVIAVWAVERGSRQLWAAVALALVLVMTFALLAASPTFGNQLSSTQGYVPTALRTLVLFGLTLGLPIVSVSIAVQMFECRKALRVAIGIVIAGLSWIAGVVLAVGAVRALG